LYDDLGQFVSLMRDGATAPVTFEYDAIGRRVAKDDGSLRTTFVWRGPVLLGEVRSAAGTSAWVYCPDDIEPLCRLDGDNPLYYSADQNSTPFELRTAWGGVVWSVDYDALGRATPLDNPPLADPLRMPGQYFDQETGLHYNCFRYYDPLHGRFTAQDPAGLTAGLNPYLFAPNPYSWVDPLGLTCNRGNAAGALPRFKGKSVPYIQRQLTRAGFTRTNPANPRNQTWRHPDGSEVRIHAYGNQATGPWRAGNNAHVHKDAPAPAPNQPRIPLDDRGHPTTRPGEIHIGIRNPADFPTVAGRDHGTGTEGRQNPASQYYSYSPP